MATRRIDQVDLAGQRVLIRVDFNVAEASAFGSSGVRRFGPSGNGRTAVQPNAFP
jgi:hypothetical protein